MSETVEPIKTLPLVFDEPRGRKKPPRHLADLDEAGRKALLEEMGLPGFRAKQLSTHYFGRLVDDPAEMTDLPAGQRDDLVAALLPELMTPLRTLEADKGTTRKTLWRLFDGALVESVLMRYPDRVTMCVSSRDRRAGARRGAFPRARRGAGRSRPRLQRGVHGHGGADGQLQGGHRRR